MVRGMAESYSTTSSPCQAVLGGSSVYTLHRDVRMFRVTISESPTRWLALRRPLTRIMSIPEAKSLGSELGPLSRMLVTGIYLVDR